jgi:predicted transposase YbfD/YdcC
VQRVEVNRGRLEARCLVRFEATAEQVCFPFVAQAARLTRATERKEAKHDQIETDWLICSRSTSEFSAIQVAQADRWHWGIENGLHLRLDVTAGEDRSRVSTPTSVLNLAMVRRAVHSLAVHWIQRCRDPRQATLRGFYDAMAANRRRKALSLVTARKTSWLPP